MNHDSPPEEKAETSTGGAKDRFVAGLAEKLGIMLNTAAIYGEPVERDGVTVIPVARARWVFGSGGGGKKGAEGSGGGGGADLRPVGFIEIRDGRAEFKPIRNRAADLRFYALGGVVALALLRGRRKGRPSR